MIKRSIALILALVVCVGVLAGCGGNGSGNNGGAGNGNVVAGGDRSNPLFDKMTEIELFIGENETYEFNGNYLDNLLQQQENIKLNVTEGYDMQQMLVDQDLPELCYMNALMWANDYGPKGAFINILEYLDRMPNLKAYLLENTETVKNLLAPDNGLYHIPVFYEGNSTPYAFIYRADIFEKHNLEFPTTRDEFLSVLRKLKELYPHSYPFVLRQMEGNMQGFMYLCMSFGTSLALTGLTQTVMDYNHETEEWYYGPTSDGMKDMVGFLAQLYKEGLLHQSTITLTSAQWTEAFAKGDDKKGVSFIGWDKMDRIPAQLQIAGEALNPEFSLVAGAPIQFNELGQAATYAGGDVTSYNWVIAKKNDNLDAVLAYLDWLYSEEGIETTNWGKEGETFEYDADGNKKFLDPIRAENDPQFTRALAMPGIIGVRDWAAYADWQTEIHKQNLAYASTFCTLPGRPSLTYNDDEQTIYDTYWMSLHDYARGELQAFITGERAMTTWDSYVKTVESDKYMFDQLMKIHETAYERKLNNDVDVIDLINGGKG